MANKKYKLDGNDYWEASGVYDIGQGDTQRNINDEVATKLATIAEGAEVNQNAFSNVAVGGTTIAADSKTDTLTLTAGSNITLTPNATNDSVTIAANDTTYDNATQSAAGLMSAADKTKLDTLDSADITDNSTVGGSTVEASLTSLKGSLTLNDGRYIVDGNSELLFIGDSYMTGVYSGGTNTSFVDIAMAQMGITKYHIKAQSGYAFVRENQTFLSLLNDTSGIADTNKITHILVFGGSNEEGTQTELINAITAFKNRAKQLYPNAKIAIGEIGWNLLNTYTYQLIADQYRTATFRNGLRYIDGMFMGTHGDMLKESDGHPNAAGQSQLSNLLISALTGELSIQSPAVIAATITLPSGSPFSGVDANKLFTSVNGLFTTLTIRPDVYMSWYFSAVQNETGNTVKTFNLGSLSNSYVHGDQFGNCSFPITVGLLGGSNQIYVSATLSIKQGVMTLYLPVENGYNYRRIVILGLNAVMPFYNS